MNVTYFSFSKFVHENFSKSALLSTEKFHFLTSFVLKIFELKDFKAGFPQAHSHFTNTFQILDLAIPSTFSRCVERVRTLANDRGLGIDSIKMKIAALDLLAEATFFADGILNVLKAAIPVFKLVMPNVMIKCAHAAKVLKESIIVILGFKKLQSFSSYELLKTTLKILCLTSAIIASPQILPLFALSSNYVWVVDVSLSAVEMILNGFEKAQNL